MISTKTFLNNDITTTKTLINQAVTVTGSILSGTYAADSNVKPIPNGLGLKLYDFPYLSSSANFLFDLTVGFARDSVAAGKTPQQTTTEGFKNSKIAIYENSAQVHVGYDANGSILQFDNDGIINDNLNKMDSCLFFNFNKQLASDEFSKGLFTIELGVGSYADPFSSVVVLQDLSGSNGFFTNSPAGHYGTLFLTNSVGTATAGASPQRAGIVFYQAGVAVVTSSVFTDQMLSSSVTDWISGPTNQDIITAMTGTSITGNCEALRHRIRNVSFVNATEINSTIMFCRGNSNEFNFSSNPTYLSGSKIRVKGEDPNTNPRTYWTTIGLYSADNRLMAVAKTSEPLFKDPTTELTLRIRLDY
jgi:hypothetical protein